MRLSPAGKAYRYQYKYIGSGKTIVPIVNIGGLFWLQISEPVFSGLTVCTELKQLDGSSANKTKYWEADLTKNADILHDISTRIVF
jgi:hypothetical protein